MLSVVFIGIADDVLGKMRLRQHRELRRFQRVQQSLMSLVEVRQHAREGTISVTLEEEIVEARLGVQCSVAFAVASSMSAAWAKDCPCRWAMRRIRSQMSIWPT